MQCNAIASIAGHTANRIVRVAQRFLDIVEENGKLRSVLFADFNWRFLARRSIHYAFQIQFFAPYVTQVCKIYRVRRCIENWFDKELRYLLAD